MLQKILKAQWAVKDKSDKPVLHRPSARDLKKKKDPFTRKNKNTKINNNKTLTYFRHVKRQKQR